MYSTTNSVFQEAAIIDRFESQLVEEGLITADQLAIAKISKENLGLDLASILVRKGFVTEEELLEFAAHQKKIPFVKLTESTIDKSVARHLPFHLARQHMAIAISQKGNRIRVAMANPFDSFALDDLKEALKAEIEPVLALSREIDEMIGTLFEPSQHAESRDLTLEVSTETESDNTGAHEMEKMAMGPKVVSLVNNIIARANTERASDIHIEPSRGQVKVRYRVDGLLRDGEIFPKSMMLPMISRIKYLSGLDIAERRIPQDGRIRVILVGKPIDLRISTCPVQHGEKVVIRLLAKDNVRSIEALGFNDAQRHVFSDIITKSHGIFLVTGPTGSGKSTTLYAALMRINSPDKNIISIEDPIENEIEGITQVNVNPKSGLSFASVLRSVLRQDPDIIMVGEIRDAETAQIAVRAAITGHMVLSTLHTNTAAGAISRLSDLGVESFLLASALKGVMAQRLVRRICPDCREKVDPSKSKITPFTSKITKAFAGKGCKGCNYTGFKGRLGIFELAVIDEDIRTLIHQKASDGKIVETLRKQGVNSILDDGLIKVTNGDTTIEEVLRVTQEE